MQKNELIKELAAVFKTYEADSHYGQLDFPLAEMAVRYLDRCFIPTATTPQDRAGCLRADAKDPNRTEEAIGTALLTLAHAKRKLDDAYIALDVGEVELAKRKLTHARVAVNSAEFTLGY